MNTKWNALGFKPGLVGGHCIGVDPYYLTNAAEKLGYHSQIILNGRKVNDSMGTFVADAAIKEMIEAGKAPKNSTVVILGLTFKENCPDTRNSKVFDIVKELREYGIEPVIADPQADAAEAERLYGIKMSPMSDVKDMDAVILAVAHKEFAGLSVADVDKYFKGDEKLLLDIKGVFNKKEYEAAGYRYWRL
jgi:UDP-N-acetyl-D-galactosamine dehydrogenase